MSEKMVNLVARAKEAEQEATSMDVEIKTGKGECKIDPLLLGGLFPKGEKHEG